MNTQTTTVVPSSISALDLLQAGGGTPDAAKPVVFEPSLSQFRAPGQYAADPLSSIPVYEHEVKAQYEMVEHSETFPNGYNDVAVAVTSVLRSTQGGVTRSVKTSPFKLPSERTVEIGYDLNGHMRYETVPGDWMTVPGLIDAMCIVTENSDGTGAVHFRFHRSHHDHIKGFLSFVRAKLQYDSIYRGQIITTKYEFVNAATFDSTLLAFNDDVAMQALTSIQSPIVHMEVIDQRPTESPRQKVMLEGPPGTGKTMLISQAQNALFRRGFSGVVLPAGADAIALKRGMHIARTLMRPDNIVGVFIEDVETMTAQNRSLLLDELDGSQSKNDRVLVVMTTNYADQIVEPAFWRPGRIDELIHVGLPDRKTFERIVRRHVGHELAEDVDFDVAYEHYHGFTPAWIVGGISKVVRSVIARTGSGDNLSVTTADLIAAAASMRGQADMQRRAVEKTQRPADAPIDAYFRDLIEFAIREIADNGDLDRDSGSDYTDYSTIESVVRDAVDGVEVLLKTQAGNDITGQLRS